MFLNHKDRVLIAIFVVFKIFKFLNICCVFLFSLGPNCDFVLFRDVDILYFPTFDSYLMNDVELEEI